MYPYELIRSPRGTINIKIGDEEYSVEEINAMILNYLYELLLKQSAEDIKDCVISIPSYYNYFQRKTMLDTLKLGNWNPLAIISENVAASIFYGKTSGIETKTVLLYNLGSTSLETAIVNFTQIKKVGSTIPHATVIGETWDFHIGANNVDLEIQKMIINEIQKDATKQLTQKTLNMIKTMSEKAKKTLSANKEVFIKQLELHEGKNLKMTITRSQVEQQLINQSWDRKLIKPIQDLLEKTQLDLDKIDSIEMLGGGSRIPLVQQVVQQFLNKELGWHINGEEDMANGNALLAANYSSTMTLRTPILLTQKPNHKYKAIIYDKNDFKRETLIDKPYGAKKDVSLTVRNDFWVDLHEDNQLYLRYKVAGTERQLTTAQESLLNKTGPEIIENQIQIKVFLSFKVNNFGWVEVDSARSQRYIYYYDYEKKNTTSDDILEFGEDNVTQEVEQPKMIMKNKTDKWELRVRNIDLVDEDGNWLISPRLMNFSEITTSEKRLQKLNQRDNDQYILVEKKNNLESLIYQVREQMYSEEFEQVTTEEKRIVLKQRLEDVEEWLQIEGPKASLDNINNQSNQIVEIVQPAYERIVEARQRNPIINQARNAIQNLQNSLASLFVSKPWVEKQKQEEVYTQINKTQQWLNEVTEKQKEKKAYEDPAFKVSQVEAKMKRIEEMIKKIERTPKPSNKTQSKSKGSKSGGGGASKPITIDGQSFTMEEFEEYQRDQQKFTKERMEREKREKEEEGEDTEESKDVNAEEKTDL